MGSPLDVESTFIRPRPTRILIVEDEISTGALLQRLLEVEGWVADHIPDPHQACSMLRHEEYSLVLLDHNMPGMDGLELLEEIRKISGVPVVMLTGSDKSALAVRAIRLGAFDYLTKPVDEKRLIATARQAIESGAGAGDRIGHYEIKREIGRGGMGVVYAARDPRLDRTIALKILLPELAADPTYEIKFLAEARAAAKFSHPNIVTVYQAGRFRGRLFLSMEFVPGETLEHYVRGARTLPLVKVLEIGLQVCAALEVMHGAGMVHRDLKPANLMMAANNLVKVLDFGLVRPLPAHGAETGDDDADYSGTLAYAAPELLDVAQVDARGDLYALGVVMYELLCGKRAFESRAMTDLMKRILESRPTIPFADYTAAPKDMVDVLRKLMARRPEDRYPNATAARAALKDIIRRV